MSGVTEKSKYATPQGYCKNTQKDIILSDGSVFKIKAPDVGILAKYIEVLSHFKGKTDAEVVKTGGERLQQLTQFIDDILPSTVVIPKVGLETNEEYLSVHDIKFVDKSKLAFAGIALSGVNSEDLSEIKDFQTAPQASS